MNSRVLEVGSLKYILSEFSREQRELQWQPNLNKNKPKLHKFQFCTRYGNNFCVMVGFLGVGEFKSTMGNFKGAKAVAMATKFGHK